MLGERRAAPAEPSFRYDRGEGCEGSSRCTVSRDLAPLRGALASSQSNIRTRRKRTRRQGDGGRAVAAGRSMAHGKSGIASCTCRVEWKKGALVPLNYVRPLPFQMPRSNFPLRIRVQDLTPRMTHGPPGLRHLILLCFSLSPLPALFLVDYLWD